MEEDYLQPDFNVVNIHETPRHFNPEVLSSFQQNQCLKNAFTASRASGDYMVEGVLIIKEKNKPILVTRHCWNKNCATGQYYDVTKDFVWSEESFLERLNESEENEISYVYVACVEYPYTETKQIDNEIRFHYKYDTIIDCFNRR